MAVFVQAVILVAASLMAAQSVQYLRDPIVTSPGILPLLVSSIVAAIAAMLLVGDAMRGVISLKAVRSHMAALSWRDVARTVGWLVLATAYAVLTPAVGFTWATLGFLIVALTLYARLEWWRTLIIAVAIATVVPFFFRYVFFAIVP